MKTTPKKVFLLENGQYVEITYQQHQERMLKNEKYAQRWFIPVQDYLLETTKENYSEYYRNAERQRYLKKLDVKYRLLSLDAFQDAEDNGFGVIETGEGDIDEQVAHKLIIEKLRTILLELPNEEQQLIKALYVDELSEREYAEKIGVYRNAVHKRKVRILAKIKIFLEK